MTELSQEDCKRIEALIDYEEYEDCIEICNNLLNFINAQDFFSNHDVWYLNLKLAVCNRKLNRLKEALNYTHMSSQYSDTLEEDYIMTMWMYGVIYFLMDKRKKAIKFYEKCADYYKNHNIMSKYMLLLKNIAMITRDSEKILIAIRLYKENKASQNSLDDAYETLCNIYIEQNQPHLAALNIHNIKNKKLYQNVQDRMNRKNFSVVL